MNQLPVQQSGGVFGIYVITGSELLLINETLDALRALFREQGFTERSKFSMSASTPWRDVLDAFQNVSLFSEKKLIEVEIPGGKPGRAGAEALELLCKEISASSAEPDTALIVVLPKLDKATLNTKWAKQLWQRAKVIALKEISPAQLPQWISSRLKQQGQTADPEALRFISHQVEGNLLAAHQEILKLGLAFPPGHITQHDIEQSIQDVARFNVFALSNAMLEGCTDQICRIVKGLAAEGEALPLVLGVILRDLRDLYQLAQLREKGQPPAQSFKQLRIFASREKGMKAALRRLSFGEIRGMLQHAHDIDRIFKGIPVPRRLHDPWEELLKLCLRAGSQT